MEDSMSVEDKGGSCRTTTDCETIETLIDSGAGKRDDRAPSIVCTQLTKESSDVAQDTEKKRREKRHPPPTM
jgi:hypothetical protein